MQLMVLQRFSASKMQNCVNLLPSIVRLIDQFSIFLKLVYFSKSARD